jgi:alpha-tubulin suppressor-like RCC1 family protein
MLTSFPKGSRTKNRRTRGSWRQLCVPLGFVSVLSGCGARTGVEPFALTASVGGSAIGIAGNSSVGGATSGAGNTAGSPSVGGAPGSSGFGSSAGNEATGGASAGTGGASAGTGGASAGTGGASAGTGGASVGGASGGGAGQPSFAPTIALGAFHTCTSLLGGRLRCWGTRGYIGSGNNLTIGDDETPDVLPDILIGDPVVQMAASWYHTCVVLESGAVRCFGDGAYGELGYGNVDTIGDDEAPASAGDVDVGGRVSRVAAGPYDTCACLEGGKLRCWGRNTEWQLGYPDSSSIGDNETPASAGDVDVGGLVVDVALGVGHTCALLDTGSVRCWGHGSVGRLGYGNTNTIGDNETPASAGDVDLGGKAVQLVAGTLHTCALLDTGKVRCWGNGSDGALGYGNTNSIGDDETPASAGDVEVGGTVVQLAAGDGATCALLDSGAVRCWGSSPDGRLGYGNLNAIGDDEAPASAGDVAVGGPVSRIAMGFWHTCALLKDGAVRCWGRASTGALGYGNTNDIGDNETPASAGDVKTH